MREGGSFSSDRSRSGVGGRGWDWDWDRDQGWCGVGDVGGRVGDGMGRRGIGDPIHEAGLEARTRWGGRGGREQDDWARTAGSSRRRGDGRLGTRTGRSRWSAGLRVLGEYGQVAQDATSHHSLLASSIGRPTPFGPANRGRRHPPTPTPRTRFEEVYWCCAGRGFGRGRGQEFGVVHLRSGYREGILMDGLFFPPYPWCYPSIRIRCRISPPTPPLATHARLVREQPVPSSSLRS